MRCPDGIDPRVPRFGQALTGSILLVAFLVQTPWLVAFVAVVLAGASLGGPRWSLWARLYELVLRPRLGPARELEDPRGPRFANRIGFTFATSSAVLLAFGAPPLGLVGWALALTVSSLALLAAASGFCLACWLYPKVRFVRRVLVPV